MGDVVFGYTSERSHLEEENALLRETIAHLKEEIDRFKLMPLMVCEIKAAYKESAIIKIPNGNQFLVGLSKDCKKLSSGDTVLVEQKNLTVVKKVGSPKGFNVEKYVIVEKPTTQWKDIGGMADQVNEIREVVELPLKNPDIFKKVGIQPPKGILLYGVPGTGKTLLAKAVATSTNATFIQVVGSELVQKFIGEGAKLIKEIFQLAREKAPSIVFIDELDALAAKRVDIGTSGEREVQRTFMQLLSELDGFQPLGNVKVIGCTNRKDILDTAIIRPGRLERMICVPAPTLEGRKEIFAIHTRDMSLENVDILKVVDQTEGFTGAEIKAVCTEAGYFAIRSNRTYVKTSDFLQAVEKVRQKGDEECKEYMTMFG
jgi:proteasome regulatory subunit